MVRSAMLLASAFPELRSQALALAEQLNDLMRVMTSIRTEGDKLSAETTRLNDARMRLAGVAGGRSASRSPSGRRSSSRFARPQPTYQRASPTWAT